jgi:hypothetical protein
MLTRSIVDMLVDASSHIDVPDEDVAEHRVNPSRPDPASNTDLFRMIRVHSGKKNQRTISQQSSIVGTGIG